jgi:hypothetical protein
MSLWVTSQCRGAPLAIIVSLFPCVISDFMMVLWVAQADSCLRDKKGNWRETGQWNVVIKE